MDSNFRYIPKPKAKNAYLWKHFGFKSEDGYTVLPGDTNKVYCLNGPCTHPEVAYTGNTTNLARHLSHHHPHQFMEYHQAYSAAMSTTRILNESFVDLNSQENSVKDEPADEQLIKPEPEDQQIVEIVTLGSVKISSSTDTYTNQITRQIVDCIVEDLLPMSFVEGSGFRKLMTTVAPNYPLANADYYAELVKNRYLDLVARIQEKLVKAQWINVTTEMWTLASQRTYFGLTAHYLTEDGALQTCLLDSIELSVEENTAKALAEVIEKRFVFWKLKAKDGSLKVYAGVCDNSSNMIKALNDHLKLPLVIGSLTHTINQCIMKAFKMCRVNALIAKTKQVVEHFCNSSEATQQLRDSQRANKIEEPDIRELMQDVPSRWVTTYQMIQRILELQDYVNAILNASKRRNVVDLVLSEDDLFQLKELSTVLQPLNLAMQMIDGEMHCSMSIVMPLLRKMLDKLLVVKNGDTPIVNEFKTTAHADLRGRYQLQSRKAAFAIAAYLDPRYKEFKFIHDDTERRENIALAKAEVRRVAQSMAQYLNAIPDDSDYPVCGNEASHAVDGEPAIKRRKSDQLLYDFIHTDDEDDSPDEEAVDLSIQARVNAQLASYALERVDGKMDVVKFWSIARRRYKDLAAIASKYITIPASISSHEQPFCLAKSTISQLRASMPPELVEQIMFLNRNTD